MASEGRQRLLPIPRSAREYPAAEHLQAAHQSTVVPGTRTPQSTCPQKVGDSHSVVRKMDTAPEGPAPLSPSSLLRHPSFIRAVCVDALVRICAGGDQTWSSLLRPWKLFANPVIGSIHTSEPPTTRTFNKMCTVRIHLSACRAHALMTVQVCLDCMQSPAFCGAIVPHRLALFRSHGI